MTIKDPKKTTVSIDIEVVNLDEIIAKVELLKQMLGHVDELMADLNASEFKATSDNGVKVVVKTPDSGGDADA